MSKIISVEKAADIIKNDMSLMIGGFLKCGCPTLVTDELLKRDTKNLILIANDTSFPDSDRGKLIAAKKIKKSIVSHIGTNPETGKQMHSGEMEVELVPQGTLAEIIRAGGAGLGGILTPTGIGTVVEKGKQIIELSGKKYILEESLKADIAIIYGSKVDSFGNVSFEGATRNFNSLIPMAAKTVIVEADQYIEGYLDPNEIVVPGIFTDYIVIK